MKKVIGALMLAMMGVAVLPGCGFILSDNGGSTTQTGEIWYVKLHCLIYPLCFSSDVYYCDGKSNTCKAADMQ